MSDDLEAKKQELREKIEELKYEFKIDLPKRIAEARALGDLKENAEYHAARERQSFVKAQLSQLNFQLSQLNNMNMDDISEDSVGYGSTITVIDMDSNDDSELTIVSPEDVNPMEGKISLSSPYGAALRNKKAGDQVEVVIPAGKRRLYIEKIITIHGNEFSKPYEGGE